jgi:hypothetical protein
MFIDIAVIIIRCYRNDFKFSTIFHASFALLSITPALAFGLFVLNFGAHLYKS